MREYITLRIITDNGSIAKSWVLAEAPEINDKLGLFFKNPENDILIFKPNIEGALKASVTEPGQLNKLLAIIRQSHNPKKIYEVGKIEVINVKNIEHALKQIESIVEDNLSKEKIVGQVFSTIIKGGSANEPVVHVYISDLQDDYDKTKDILLKIISEYCNKI